LFPVSGGADFVKLLFPKGIIPEACVEPCMDFLLGKTSELR
jgi:hypothetical protein